MAASCLSQSPTKMSSWCSAPLWTCADVINPGYRRRKPPLMQKTLLAVAKNPSTVAKNPPSTVAKNPQHRPSQKTLQPTHCSKKPPLPTQKTRSPFHQNWCKLNQIPWHSKPSSQTFLTRLLSLEKHRSEIACWKGHDFVSVEIDLQEDKKVQYFGRWFVRIPPFDSIWPFPVVLR